MASVNEPYGFNQVVNPWRLISFTSRSRYYLCARDQNAWSGGWVIPPGKTISRYVLLSDISDINLSVMYLSSDKMVEHNQWQLQIKKVSFIDFLYEVFKRISRIHIEYRDQNLFKILLRAASFSIRTKSSLRINLLKLYHSTFAHFSLESEYANWRANRYYSLANRSAPAKNITLELSVSVAIFLSGSSEQSEALKTLESFIPLGIDLNVLFLYIEHESSDDVTLSSNLASYCQSQEIQSKILKARSFNDGLRQLARYLEQPGCSDWLYMLQAGGAVDVRGFSSLLKDLLDTERDAVITDEETYFFGEDSRRPQFKHRPEIDSLLAGQLPGESLFFRPYVLRKTLGEMDVYGELSLISELNWLLLLVYFQVKKNFSRVAHCPEIFLSRPFKVASQHASLNTQAAADHYLKANDLNAHTVDHTSGSLKVIWGVPDPKPLVSIIVPTRDQLEVLRPCIESLLENTEYNSIELIIVDNGSQKIATLDYLKQVSLTNDNVRVVRDDSEFNFSRLINLGVSNARGDLVALVNNDILVQSSGWLQHMVGLAVRRDVGCVGAKLYYPDGRIQHAGIVTGIGGIGGHIHRFEAGASIGYDGRLFRTHEVAAVTAACMVFERSLFKRVGGFNEELSVNYNDLDFCLRVRKAGYRNLLCPWAEFVHYESVSRGVTNTREQKKRAQREWKYMRKNWGAVLDADPFYNPNLTLTFEDASLR